MKLDGLVDFTGDDEWETMAIDLDTGQTQFNEWHTYPVENDVPYEMTWGYLRVAGNVYAWGIHTVPEHRNLRQVRFEDISPAVIESSLAMEDTREREVIVVAENQANGDCTVNGGHLNDVIILRTSEGNLGKVKVSDCEKGYWGGGDRYELVATLNYELYPAPPDGTVTDPQTGLMWERKQSLDGTGNSSNPHDADNRYTWSASGSAPDGTAFTDFLDKMNNRCDGNASTACTSNVQCAGIGYGRCGYAGYRDWRLPSIEELETILLIPCDTSPCIDQTIFGPTQANVYWSSTPDANDPTSAWRVYFLNGEVLTRPKTNNYYVRAVRGGL